MAMRAGEREEATYRAVSFERVCYLAYDMMLTGREPSVIEPAIREEMKRTFFWDDTVEFFWNGAVRLLLQEDDSVLG